jgi:hypothetical protein
MTMTDNKLFFLSVVLGAMGPVLVCDDRSETGSDGSG